MRAPRQRVGAHRPRRGAAAVLAPLVVVLLVLAVALGVRFVASGGGGDGTSAASSSSSASGSAPAATSAASSGTAAPGASGGSGTAASGAGSSGSSPASSSSGAVDRSAPLRVLNATRRAGLATRAAATLRSAGWAVSSLGNTDGGDGPATTTVYYSGAGLLATARAVSHDLPGSQRVMRSQRFGDPAVTVVLGADYAG